MIRDLRRFREEAATGACSAVLALAALAAPLAAQQGGEEPGRLKGRVVGTRDASPITTAQVTLEGTDIGTLSDVQGRYFLRDVPPGTYSVVVSSLGYAKKTVTGVTVTSGEVTTLDLTLETQAVQVSDVTVSVAQARGSAASVLNRQKNAAAVTDGIGAEQISRSAASNAAETARQLTGVTVSEGKYVHVRGLGERYSQTSLNGSPLPSPEPEKGVVPLDLFPAGFLDNLTVQKTYTPDKPADFSGGSVEIETRDYPDHFTFNASVGTSLNARSQFAEGYLSYPGGSRDFLGMDDGTRDLPDLIESELGGLGGRQLPTDDASLERFGESFLSEDLRSFSPSSGSTPANLGVGASMGDRVEVFGKELGYVFSATYSNTYSLRDDEVEQEYRSEAFDPVLVAAGREIRPNNDYAFIRATREVNWGGMGNVTLQLSPEHELGLKTLYNRNATDESRRIRGANREDITGELLIDRLRFVSRSMAWGQLSGEHRLGATTLEWRGTAARATRDEPGLRETIYRRPLNAEPGAPFTLDSEGPAPRYLFDELADDDLNGGVDWTVPLGFIGADDVKLKVGGFGRTRHRDFEARRFRWQFRGTITSLDSALTEEAVVGRLTGPGQFLLQEIFQPGDDYTTDDDLVAGYGMLTLPLGPVEVVGGARVEDYDLLVDVAAGEDRDASLDATDVLPAANVTVALTEDMNIRAALSETLDRPEFRELAPFQFTEAISLREVFGNPGLEITRIRNWDLRWEWFPSPGEVLSLSGFYKELDRPIEQVFVKSAGAAYSYQNAESGTLRGVELGLRKNLGFLAPALEGLSLAGNVALIDSEVTVSQEGVFDPTNLERELEGQSPYTVNASLSYQAPEGGTEANLSFNVFGQRITAAGGSGIPDIEEQPRPQLEFTLEQPLWRSMELKLEAENLLDPAHEWTQTANGIMRVQRRFHEGQSFSASVSFRR